MEFRQAFEESLAELNFGDLDDTPEDIPFGTDEKADDSNPRDEDSDAEPEDGSSDSSDDEESDDSVDATPLIEIVEGADLKLPDGTVVPASKALLLQADYTRKTQELALRRKKLEQEAKAFEVQKQEVDNTYSQMRSWYEERAANPSGWIAEIVSQSPDGTAVIAKALYDLAEAGALDPRFVETFGLKSGEIADTAKRSKVEDEVAQLRRSIEERENAERMRQLQEQREQAISQRTAIYEQEWEQIKTSNDLQFASKAEEAEVKQRLLNFAIENKVSRSLLDAWDLMSVRTGRVTMQRPKVSDDVSDKKRASRAVTPKTAVSGESKRAKKNVSDREAILEAMESLAL